ncbi:glycosyltransferase [Candidatus Woesearchaeota archaeon]|nr:glycosyltransferase [Candidatus Woesearchaeota archaeon]
MIPLTHFPLTTVTVPAYNEEDTISNTIKSIIELDYPKDKLELIVVNDGSKDNTELVVNQIIKENPQINIMLINQKNAGKGAALNKALNLAKGDFFVPLDADSYIRSDALKAMLPHFANKNVAAVLPLMKIKDPKNLLQKIQWAEYMVNLFYKRLMSLLDCVHVAPGPFSVYRKKILLGVGGFDEHNLTEDLEVTLKLQKNNYKIIQVMNTEVYTIPPDSLKGFYRQRNRWYKGTILNALKYRKMAFNKKYEDFGLIQMPRILLEGVFVILSLMIITYNSILKPLFYKVYYFSLVNFNILPFISGFFRNFHLIDIDMTRLFFTLIVMIFAGLLIYSAHRHTNEKFSRNSLIAIPSYILFYSILSSTIMLLVFIDVLMGKKQKW